MTHSLWRTHIVRLPINLLLILLFYVIFLSSSSLGSSVNPPQGVDLLQITPRNYISEATLFHCSPAISLMSSAHLIWRLLKTMNITVCFNTNPFNFDTTFIYSRHYIYLQWVCNKRYCRTWCSQITDELSTIPTIPISPEPGTKVHPHLIWMKFTAGFTDLKSPWK